MSARLTVESALAVCVITVLVGCSNAPGPAAGDSTHTAVGANNGAAQCGTQPVTVKDMTGILIEPITGTKHVSGDSQSCEYSTGSFPAITISVRPGLGQSTVDAWIAGRMPLKARPISGVGDAAVWQASLHEVIAQQRNVLCDIQVRGGAGDIAIPMAALPAALGALCNRIFAAG